MTRSALIHLVITTLIVCAIGAGYFFWYRSVIGLSERAATLTQSVSEKNDEVARIAVARAAFASVVSNEDAINSYFVSQTGIVAFLEELQAKGKPFGASVDVVSVSADNATKPPHLTIALKIDGSFDAVMRTVGALEYAPRDLVVNDLTLTSSMGEKGTTWTATGAITVGTRAPQTASTTKP
ncbi:MAG: hypothetical protein ABA06_02610 [Parcubacteria bacterium C7867-001]|nr:MAG: hypothetical protein ABA06_02610 [Parcubacteria bacterium C7867-001]